MGNVTVSNKQKTQATTNSANPLEQVFKAAEKLLKQVTTPQKVSAKGDAKASTKGAGNRRDKAGAGPSNKPNARGETSRWEVRVQPINEGRVNPDINTFSSNRKVTGKAVRTQLILQDAALGH